MKKKKKNQIKKKRPSLNPNSLSNWKLFLISSVLNYVPRVPLCHTCLTWLGVFIFLRALRAFIFVCALCTFLFLRVLRAFMFLLAFIFYVFYILFMYMLIKLTQNYELTYDCSSLLLLKSTNVY